MDNPYEKKVGGKLRFKILFTGESLVDKTVFADNRNGEKFSKQKMKTDNNGIVEVKLNNRGTWLVRLVFMRRCMDQCGDTDWESFWGSYSFGVK